MSKQSKVLEVAAEIARSFGASQSQINEAKRKLAEVWGESSPAAPAAPETRTFNVQVGVEVLASVGARQSDVENAIRAAVEQAASGRDEVVSISVAGA